MIEITTDDLVFSVNESKLKTLQMRKEQSAHKLLADLWGADIVDLRHYQLIFFDKSIEHLSDKDSFLSLAFTPHGYIMDTKESIDVSEAKKQIEIDLEIINRESQWRADESIYFGDWWPEPTMDTVNHVLDFGLSLKDFNQKVFNRTINRLILTRYGHILLNYSLSEEAVASARPLDFYRNKMNEVSDAITIAEGYRYIDVDEDNDMPSRSRLINLILSSEIF